MGAKLVDEKAYAMHADVEDDEPDDVDDNGVPEKSLFPARLLGTYMPMSSVMRYKFPFALHVRLEVEQGYKTITSDAVTVEGDYVVFKLCHTYSQLVVLGDISVRVLLIRSVFTLSFKVNDEAEQRINDAVPASRCTIL